jgi:hypothetical protein
MQEFVVPKSMPITFAINLVDMVTIRDLFSNGDAIVLRLRGEPM